MSAEQSGGSGPAVTARELVRTAVVPAAPDAVWELVGRFGALDAWHPYVPKAVIEGGSDPEQPGAVRVFSIEGTVVAREELLDRDPAARVLVRRGGEPAPAPGVRRHPGRTPPPARQ
ncbi:SRPBCC family protein [Streptomyces sp. NBC_00335]|uniref:SRPBCC family protein n=1 Tax=unclassified Streptomyces TaxID=2593676 RepID=UPI0022568F6B|nr:MULTISPECIES: SRPBCC family protein [unclassified Streptomyces]MCX5402881.1 SRPBCC family protein [Streptomyces sp. NBC_00086]